MSVWNENANNIVTKKYVIYTYSLKLFSYNIIQTALLDKVHMFLSSLFTLDLTCMHIFMLQLNPESHIQMQSF